jgi:hypothetical protein
VTGVGSFKVGERVRVERDESRWPSRGSWPKYRGRVGTVVRLNRRDGEIGVSFSNRGPNATGVASTDSWFLPRELVPAGPPEGQQTVCGHRLGAADTGGAPDHPTVPGVRYDPVPGGE